MSKTIKKDYDLIIFEPLLGYFPSFYPDLGVAMVTAACREQGMKVKVIGSTQSLIGSILEYDKEEWLSLYKEIKQEDPLHKIVRQKHNYPGTGKPMGGDPETFWQILKKLHDRIFYKRDLRSHMRGEIFSQYVTFSHALFQVMKYHLEKNDNEDIPLIRRYMDSIAPYEAVAVGFSTTFQIDSFTLALMRKIKQRHHSRIIVGGAFTSYLDDSELKTVLTDYQADAIVISEGEIAVPQLLDQWKTVPGQDSTPNTVYLDGKGELRKNPVLCIEDLNTLPVPEFDLLSGDHYCTAVDILPVQSTRGCRWNKCAFCSNARMRQNNQRRFSPSRFVEVIKILTQKYGVRHFTLPDEEVPPDHALAISRQLIAESLEVYLDAYVRFDPQFIPTTFQTMSQAGFRGLIWGLESGSQKVLDLMQKGTKTKTASRILRDSFKNKIYNTVLLIFGFPGEKREDIEATFRFLAENRSSIGLVRSSPYILNWGSFVSRFPEKYGIDPLRIKYKPFNKELFFADLLSISYPNILKRLDLLEHNSCPVRCLPECPYSISLLMLINSFDPVCLDDIGDQREVLLNYYPLAFPQVANKKDNKVVSYNYFRKAFFNYFPNVRYMECSAIKLFLLRQADGKTLLKDIIVEAKEKIGATMNEILEEFYRLGTERQMIFFKKSWKS